PRLPELVDVDDEVLLEDGTGDGRADGREVTEAPLEVGIGQHREGGGAGLDVLRGAGDRVEALGEDAGDGRGPLQLGEQPDARGPGGPQRGPDAAGGPAAGRTGLR